MLVILIVVTILVLLLFLVLKSAVKSINNQAETYFVDKLQSYDDLIKVKEEKIASLEEVIQEKKVETKEENKNIEEKSGGLDYNDLTTLAVSSEYQSSSALDMKHLIDERFNVDVLNIINKFISSDTNKNSNTYNLLIDMKNKLNMDTIYRIECMEQNKRDEFVKSIFTDTQYKIYLKFVNYYHSNDIEKFLNLLNYNIQHNSPFIYVLVGNKQENYNYLSEKIKTTYDKRIYKGIKIKYRNKIYDYSISEGRGIV